MNNEIKLISRVIQDRNLGEVLEQGVNESWFTDPADKKIFKFLREHYAEYQETATLDVVKENFPTYELTPSEDNIQYFVDYLMNKKRKQLITSTLGSALEFLEREQNHEDALVAMQRGIIKIEEEGLNKSNDIEVTVAAKDAIREYEHRKANPGLLGIPTGFPTIDKATSGLQPGQLIVIVALPKTGKSTLALQIAANMHTSYKTPMFMSFEMTNEEQKSRYYAMRARISHKRLMTGSLTDDEEKRFYKVVNGISTMSDKFWFADSVNGQTVSSIASKIQDKNPDVVFIDGTYLMIDEITGEMNKPEAITNITRNLKKLALKIKKPIVITTQALSWKTRGGQVTADSIGYSSSFHQDADVIFGLQREDENIDSTRLLRVVAARNTGLCEASLDWDWDTGYFREMDETDL